MAQTRERTEITEVQDLRQLAEEVRTSGTPRLLVLGDDEVAMIVPVRAPGSLDNAKTEIDDDEDLQEFLSSAGSWRGHIDPDEFMRRVREGRSSNRPSVTFSDAGQ
ncbi:MAG: hypothetical protein ACR2LS_05210 [Thermomicrobiales bacterium]